MTVIIKELVVRTGVVENLDKQPGLDALKLKNDIIKDCLQELKKKARYKAER